MKNSSQHLITEVHAFSWIGAKSPTHSLNTGEGLRISGLLVDRLHGN